MAATIPTTTTTELLRAQLAALESIYRATRTTHDARRILDLIHVKRDELAMAETIASIAA